MSVKWFFLIYKIKHSKLSYISIWRTNCRNMSWTSIKNKMYCCLKFVIIFIKTITYNEKDIINLVCGKYLILVTRQIPFIIGYKTLYTVIMFQVIELLFEEQSIFVEKRVISQWRIIHIKRMGFPKCYQFWANNNKITSNWNKDSHMHS